MLAMAPITAVPQWSSHLGDAQSTRLSVLGVPFWYWKPGWFLESCWSLLQDGGLRMWVQESAGNQQQQWWVKSDARGKAKQGSGWILLCHNLSFLDCYRKIPPTPGKDLPASIKAIMTVLQLKLLMQEILICSELTLKQTIITSTLIKFRIKCLPAYLFRK